MHQSLIIQHLFQVNSLKDVSRERLETFVEDHPSFGIGHYLLSRKLQNEDTGGFEEKTQLTSLYFSNPFWLQWLLENTDVGGRRAVPVAPADIHEEVPVVETVAVLHVEPAVVLHEEPAAAIHEEPAAGNTDHAEATAAGLATEEIPHVENVVTMAEEAFHDESAAAPPMPVGEEASSAAEQLLRSIEEARILRESLQKINTNFGDEPSVNGEEPAPVHEEAPIRDEEVPFVLDETEETRLAAVQEPAPQPAEPAYEPIALAAAEPINVAAEPVAMPEPAAVTEPVAVTEPAAVTDPVAVTEPAAVTDPVAAASEPVGATEPVLAHREPIVAPDILFEPLHTIDYFASQGIKFNLDENPADALGKQLKSFTDWLKTMRRLPQKNKEVIPDRLAEQAIQNFAAHSIEGKEVLTEAMAEVLAKQGMKQRARAVYEKLSLLNPEKSAYFVAKIEQLNIL